MKIRNGFVSNSSSTSFTCDFCGVTEAGSDGCGIQDFGMEQCPRGHTICRGHMLDSVETADVTELPCWKCKELAKYDESEDYFWCEKCQTATYPDEESTIDKSECPLCQMQGISDSDLIKYYIKTFATSVSGTRKQVSHFINKEFEGDYAKFCEFIKGVDDAN